MLPEPTLDAVERQVLDVARLRERLRAAGQHLKRGLLLYGPPGTGKTHTVRYLLGSLDGATAVVLSGTALHMVSAACTLARATSRRSSSSRTSTSSRVTAASARRARTRCSSRSSTSSTASATTWTSSSS